MTKQADDERAVTPRPWKWTNGNLIRVVGPSAEVIAGVHKIGRYLGDHGAVDLARANAAHICLCVNAFDEMKAALEWARDNLAHDLDCLIRQKADADLKCTCAMDAVFESVDAALALAKGDAP